MFRLSLDNIHVSRKMLETDTTDSYLSIAKVPYMYHLKSPIVRDSKQTSASIPVNFNLPVGHLGLDSEGYYYNQILLWTVKWPHRVHIHNYN